MNYDIVPMRVLNADGSTSTTIFNVQVKMNNGVLHTNIKLDEALMLIALEVNEMYEKLYGGENTSAENPDEYRSNGNIIKFPITNSGG